MSAPSAAILSPIGPATGRQAPVARPAAGIPMARRPPPKRRRLPRWGRTSTGLSRQSWHAIPKWASSSTFFHVLPFFHEERLTIV
jgi:hypothetical protein